jgi:Na+/H+ antiporter NhaB
MASAQEQFTDKLTLAALGVIVGIGTYSVAKTLLTPRTNQNQDNEKHKEIEKELKKTMTGMSNQFLEKHSLRLMELVAQRQE